MRSSCASVVAGGGASTGCWLLVVVAVIRRTSRRSSSSNHKRYQPQKTREDRGIVTTGTTTKGHLLLASPSWEGILCQRQQSKIEAKGVQFPLQLPAPLVHLVVSRNKALIRCCSQSRKYASTQQVPTQQDNGNRTGGGAVGGFQSRVKKLCHEDGVRFTN